MDPDKSRIATLLRNNEMRTAVQELSGQQGIAPSRATAFTSDMINEHLRRPRAIVEHVEFFDRNRLSEAIILDKLRPSLLIRDSLFEISTVPVIEKKIKPARQRMAKPIGSIGRIELFDHDTFDWCGTGWRVDEDLVITNRHVAEVFTQRQGSTFRFALNRRGKRVRASIDFREEYGGEESAEYAMAEIVWVADDDDRSPDMAVLRIAKTQGLPDPLELAAKDPVADQWMGVVGYPAYDSRND
ncbi:MAG TPA: serine protease, partial [Flavobacteriales bacterium]|nr:serine protease [Flavobacteriales bacterium]